MKILITCEYFGRVRDVFIKLSYDAISCDLKYIDLKGKYYQGDVFDIINDGFDLMIAHPPCTFLTCSAEWAYKDREKINKKLSPDKLYGEERKAAREEASEFFIKLAEADIEKIAIENPVGVMSSRFRKPEQTIQPYNYGHNASKRTCLWLKNLPKLLFGEYIEPRLICCARRVKKGEKCFICGNTNPLKRWGNQTDSGQNTEPPKEERGEIRSLTYQGIANAMAETWGNL